MPPSNSDPNEESVAPANRDFKTRFFDRYPRISRILLAFRRNPLSGDTLRMLVNGQEEISRDSRKVNSLKPPIMWQRDAPIVISQYASYASNSLPQYWNATLPDVKEQYAELIRYEHHDVPSPNSSLTQYKLATVGRAIQHKAGDASFWDWYNTIMVDGVQTVGDAYRICDDLSLGVERSYLEDAVEMDLYSDVIWNDINTLLAKASDGSNNRIEQKIDDGDPVFVVFVNGVPVEPSYDSIVGTIEQIRSTHNGF